MTPTIGPRKVRPIVVFVFVVALVIAALFFGPRNAEFLNKWFGTKEEVETDWKGSFLAGISRLNRLQVLRVETFQVVTARTPGPILWPDSRTIAVVPATIDYHVDLSQSVMHWDEKRRELTVWVPNPAPGDVNIYPERTQVFEDGLDMSTGDQRQRAIVASVERARTEIARRALNEFFVGQARSAARAAMGPMFENILKVSRPAVADETGVTAPQPTILIGFGKPAFKR